MFWQARCLHGSFFHHCVEMFCLRRMSEHRDSSCYHNINYRISWYWHHNPCAYASSDKKKKTMQMPVRINAAYYRMLAGRCLLAGLLACLLACSQAGMLSCFLFLAGLTLAWLYMRTCVCVPACEWVFSWMCTRAHPAVHFLIFFWGVLCLALPCRALLASRLHPNAP